MYLIVFLASIAAVVFFYSTSIMSNVKNRPIETGPRWLYYLAVVIAFGAFGVYLSSILTFGGYGMVIMAGVVMIPGLSVCLGKVVIIPGNEIAIIQNTFRTQKVPNGDTLHLFARSGITPLLHGEVVRESWKQETREISLKVQGMETKDSTPVDVSFIFWITQDFENMQASLTAEYNQALWWLKVTRASESIITAKVSDIIKETDVGVAITNKASMSQKFKNNPFSGKYLFEEEQRLGFKITGFKFKDIDLTADVRSANEQVLKSSAYGRAAKQMLQEMGVKEEDLMDMSPEKREKALDRVLASASKIKVHVIDVKTSEGNNKLDTATATMVKAVMEEGGK